MNFSRDRLLLYAVTDRAWVGRYTLMEQLEQALEGGVTLVQLREKQLDEPAFLRQAIQARRLCHSYGVPLIVNDNLEVALKSGADGIHVGLEDAPVQDIRHRTGADFIIGATCKTVLQAQAAQRDGADYMGVGAVFGSTTKTGALRITRQQLKEICESVAIPAVAIGGISLQNAAQLQNCSAAGIAVVSALFAAQDIRATARALAEEARKIALP